MVLLLFLILIGKLSPLHHRRNSVVNILGGAYVEFESYGMERKLNKSVLANESHQNQERR